MKSFPLVFLLCSLIPRLTRRFSVHTSASRCESGSLWWWDEKCERSGRHKTRRSIQIGRFYGRRNMGKRRPTGSIVNGQFEGKSGRLGSKVM